MTWVLWYARYPAAEPSGSFGLAANCENNKDVWIEISGVDARKEVLARVAVFLA